MVSDIIGCVIGVFYPGESTFLGFEFKTDAFLINVMVYIIFTLAQLAITFYFLTVARRYAHYADGWTNQLKVSETKNIDRNICNVCR